jgi:D-beta-D-heptose 7-phosphate kinase/D-beta-D-heptose 1-phosphate adenosyltransferase
MGASNYHLIADRFASQRVLVAGDLMLDEFIWGRVSRISPEAPVPVVDVTAESYYPGGAANVARNVREFTAHTAVLGMAGDDVYGNRLTQLLETAGIATAGVLQDAAAFTTVKTRIIARHQQVVRVDRERHTPPTPAQTQRALSYLDSVIENLDAIVISDYGKGFLTQPLADHISRLVTQKGKLLTVDPHPQNPLRWTGAAAIKPNRAEAFLAAGMRPSEPVHPPLEDAALLEVGRRILETSGAPCLLVTLGEQGMMLFQRDAAPYHTPTRAQAVFDVSGAGDTAISLFTLGLAAGATPCEAAELANHASGIVVGKLGTATATQAELLASFSQL